MKLGPGYCQFAGANAQIIRRRVVHGLKAVASTVVLLAQHRCAWPDAVMVAESHPVRDEAADQDGAPGDED